ncbi:MAG: hypothetical protein WCF65_08115 [Parachlamydiaceae bacterium]
MCTKRLIGEELKRELSQGYNIQKISSLAAHWYVSYRRECVSDIDAVLNRISLMDAGPEFVLTVNELNTIADRLINEGEKEELGAPIPEIREIAEDLGDTWLMCPFCQEAWQSQSTYGMVECPQCKSKLHNPRFKALP